MFKILGYTLYILGEQGPVVQSLVSLTSSLVVKMLTVLVLVQYLIHTFLLNKCEYHL